MNIKMIALAATALLLVGCANISTLSRTTILPPRGDGPVTGTGPQSNQANFSGTNASGLAIHLDAPQRVVLSKNGIVCAEPSPDALQAFAASQGLSLMTPNNISVQLANAFSGNASSIGLRTQSITLMREILYRICESAYSGWLTPLEVAQMTKRAQELTLGVLAIEQLTGAVKAQQVAMSTKANADASANLAATRQSLVAAREDEQIQKKAATEAAANRDAQKKIVATKQGVVDKPPTGQDPAVIDASKADLEKEKILLGELTDKAKMAEDNYQDAKNATIKIQENLGKAMSVASAEAEGEAKFSGAESVKNISGDGSAQYISWATNQIVTTIINKDHIVDSCITLLNQYAGSEFRAAQISEFEYQRRILGTANQRAPLEGVGPRSEPPQQSRGLTAEEKVNRLQIKRLCMVVIATKASAEAAAAAASAAAAERSATAAEAKTAAPGAPAAPNAASPAKEAGKAAAAAAAAAAGVAAEAAKAMNIE